MAAYDDNEEAILRSIVNPFRWLLGGSVQNDFANGLAPSGTLSKLETLSGPIADEALPARRKRLRSRERPSRL
jgi:hypothetical protein